MATTSPRPLHVIAADVKATWKNVYYGARPYLDAMGSLYSITDKFYEDDARAQRDHRPMIAAVVALTASLLSAPSPIVPCGSDADCAVKNPGVSTYGTIHEEDPGWVCSRMGNNTCGPSGDVNGVRGIYPVPGGERIEWVDRSQFVPMPDGWASVYQGQPGEDPAVIEPDSLN